MPQFGSNVGMVSQNISTVVDPQGNQIVSSDNSFGGSPLGVAARTQALYGIPNANFNLTPPDVTIPIDTSNPLPYWEISSQGAITAEMYYDETRSQWSVNLDPTSAGSGDFLTLKARSYLLNDSGLTLRQKAYATLEKIGTYSSTNQWNLVLSATYYDANGSALSTYAIGTAAQNATWTGINGFTTSGTAAINASAVYCDFDFTMTAIATVSGTVTAHIDALLIQTSVTSGGGASSFLIADTFTSSGTWTRPAGVDYVTIVLVGGGGGGASGDATISDNTGSGAGEAGGGGGGGGYLYLPDLYVGGADSYTVTVGAGGSGGTANTITKAAGGTTLTLLQGVNGSNGGTTSFGTVQFASGGVAGGTTSGSNNVYLGGGGGGYASVQWGAQLLSVVGSTGGEGGRSVTARAGSAGGTNIFVSQSWTLLPYQGAISYPGTGFAGGSGVITFSTAITALTTATGGTAAGGGSGYFAQAAGGGGGAFVNTATSPNTGSAGTGGVGAAGAGGGGGGAIVVYANATGTGVITATGGDGGNAAGTSAAGGGGGGAARYYPTTLSNQRIYSNAITVTSGKGGNGGQGYAVVIYIA